MATFTDPRKREWQINITAGDLKRLKRDAGVDLRDALRPDAGKLAEVLDDPEKFLDLMWALCGRQSTTLGIKRAPPPANPDDPPDDGDYFDNLFDRDTTVSAVAAVWESIWDFSRGQKVGTEARTTLLAARDEVEDATATALQLATRQLKAGQILSDSASGSEASPALIIGDIPSPN